jgi:hypothetical protein
MHLEPAPTTRDRLNGMATVVGQEFFPFIQDTLGGQRALMSALRLFMEQGKNIAVVTGPHVKIADVALLDVGYSEHIDEEYWQEQCGLIISRGVTTIEAFETAASQVAQEAGHVFMSFPRTSTIEELIVNQDILTDEQFESLISTNNRRMRKEVREWLAIDLRANIAHAVGKRALGKTLFTAWEGQTTAVDYGEDHRPERIALKRAHPAILDVLKHCMVLPATIWDDSNRQVLELGELTEVKTVGDIQRVQEWQRQTLATALELPDDTVTISR